MARTHGNTRYPADTVAAALSDLDKGATLKAAEAKHGISFNYLAALKKNRQRRRDAQKGRNEVRR